MSSSSTFLPFILRCAFLLLPICCPVLVAALPFLSPTSPPSLLPPAPPVVVACHFGECVRWHILLVPLLTDEFSQVTLLKAIIRSMLAGCRWYFPDIIRIELFTKNNSFVPITDPILLPELDLMLDQFKYTAMERSSRHPSQWRTSVEMAVQKLNGDEPDWKAVNEKTNDGNGIRLEDATNSNNNNSSSSMDLANKSLLPSSSSSSSSEEEEEEGEDEADLWDNEMMKQGRGRFIFVITNFGKSQSGGGGHAEFMEQLDQQLAESGIFFRNVRLQFDGHKQIQIIPGGGGASQPTIRERVNNISSNIVRVAIVGDDDGLDAFAAIRPCPQLNDRGKIREYAYVQHFYYANWFLRNPRGALIGFALFISAILCAVSAYTFHIWEQSRARRKAAAVAAATTAMAAEANTSGVEGAAAEKAGGGD